MSPDPGTRQRQKLFWLIVLGMQWAAITRGPAAAAAATAGHQLLWPDSLSRENISYARAFAGVLLDTLALERLFR